MSLDIERYDLEKVVFEARYTANWMHWDRAGAVWTDANRKFPELHVVSSQPQQTTFMLGRAIQLQVLNDRLNVLSAKPLDMEATLAAADEITRLVVKHFGVSAMSRLGMRLIYFQSKPDAGAAAAEVFQLSGLRPPSGKHFGIDGEVTEPQIGLRWETSTRGVTVRVAAEHRNVKFSPNADIAAYVEPVNVDVDGVTVDVDFYTKGEIPTDSFRPSHLVVDAQRVIRRDLNGFLLQAHR